MSSNSQWRADDLKVCIWLLFLARYTAETAWSPPLHLPKAALTKVLDETKAYKHLQYPSSVGIPVASRTPPLNGFAVKGFGSLPDTMDQDLIRELRPFVELQEATQLFIPWCDITVTNILWEECIETVHNSVREHLPSPTETLGFVPSGLMLTAEGS